MRPALFLLLAALAALVTGCATDDSGRRLGAWKTLQKWDDSMNTTVDRLQAKSY